MMNNPSSATLFLLTGLVSACGSYRTANENSTSPANTSDPETEALLAALTISQHYPDTPFATAADTYIEINGKK